MFLVYSRIFRYILFFITLFMVIFSFSVWKANKDLSKKIINLENQIQNLKRKIYFEKKFYLKFLENTGLSYMIFSHKNGIPLDGEIIFKFSRENNLHSKFIKQNNKVINSGVSNINYWYYFLKEKFSDIF